MKNHLPVVSKIVTFVVLSGKDSFLFLFRQEKREKIIHKKFTKRVKRSVSVSFFHVFLFFVAPPAPQVKRFYDLLGSAYDTKKA